MDTAARPRLTAHQTEVLGRLRRISPHMPDGWVADRYMGCTAALGHLVRKGYVERRYTFGPRGGRRYSSRPL